MTTNTLPIPSTILTDTARHLLKASRFTAAAELLAAAPRDSQDVNLALARAETIVATDWHHARVTPAEALADSQRIVDAHGDTTAGWTLDFLSMRARYAEQLFSESRQRRHHTESQLTAMAEVRRRAQALRDEAPDEARRGWAEFYLGLISDNVFAERKAAPEHYEAALHAAEAHADDHLSFEALRHLGDHDHDAGDHELTRQRWQRSAFHAARAGLVGGTLAQLVLVAVAAGDHGDEPGAALLATEVARWAEAIGYDRIREQATGLVAGVDPTVEPQPAER